MVATIGRLEPKSSALETRGQFAAELVGTHDGLGSLQQRGRGGGRRAAVARPCDLRARLVRFDGRDGRGREPERIADAARRPRRLRPGAVRPWISPARRFAARDPRCLP